MLREGIQAENLRKKVWDFSWEEKSCRVRISICTTYAIQQTCLYWHEENKVAQVIFCVDIVQENGGFSRGSTIRVNDAFRGLYTTNLTGMSPLSYVWFIMILIVILQNLVPIPCVIEKIKVQSICICRWWCSDDMTSFPIKMVKKRLTFDSYWGGEYHLWMMLVISLTYLDSYVKYFSIWENFRCFVRCWLVKKLSYEFLTWSLSCLS